MKTIKFTNSEAEQVLELLKADSVDGSNRDLISDIEYQLNIPPSAPDVKLGEYTDTETPLFEVVGVEHRYTIAHDVHFVYYGLGQEIEYPDGYEVKGKWEVREYTNGDSGDTEFVECDLSLKAAKAMCADGLYVIDRDKQAEPFSL